MDYVKCLYLHEKGDMSAPEISIAVQGSRTATYNFLTFCKHKQLTYAKAAELGNSAVQQIYAPGNHPNRDGYLPIDMDDLHKKLGPKGTSILDAWKDYGKQAMLAGLKAYSYNHYCYLYRQFCGKHRLIMRISHKPGATMEVDWAGKTVEIRNPKTGETRKGYVFVAALSYSLHFYYELCENMDEDTWIMCHVHAFEYFGGVPRLVKCDNLKTGVITHKRMEILIQKTYNSMASHYDTAILPCKPRKPTHKPYAEGTVGYITRRLIQATVKVQPTSFQEAEDMMREEAKQLETEYIKNLRSTRREYYEREEKSFMKPLPPTRYEPVIWIHATPRGDYCIMVDSNRYSVPYQLRYQRLDVCLSKDRIMVYSNGEKVADHERLHTFKRAPNILPEHMPPNHRAYAAYSYDYFMEKAKAGGPETARVMQGIFDACKEPEQGYDYAASVVHILDKVGPETMEAACQNIQVIPGSMPALESLGSLEAPEANTVTEEEKPSEAKEKSHMSNGMTRGEKHFSQSEDFSVASSESAARQK